eukprot:TRINITY_DN4918_c1_g1_i1.p1 TRINITY_DN4918_c1_g1~~TRINITY_DN4918_c1_g1_i1.p1  ORF type:complete len:819 (+),score=217.16 TRINITY_DN4918_c1_g1_i1:60-2516(+)
MAFSARDVRKVMDEPRRVRNVSVIGQIGHGKSVLVRCLAEAAGIADQPQTDEDRAATERSTAMSLLFSLPEQRPAELEGAGGSVVVNLLDSPGHADLSGEVAAALRLSDGAVVVVDFCEGVVAHTETLLRQALAERIRPVLHLNKVDRTLFDLRLDPEDVYQNFSRTVEAANAVITTYLDEALGDARVLPDQGTVSFGSGLDSWAFTVRTFARMYARKFGIEEGKMEKRLWGDSFFDSKRKKWVSVRTDGCTRAFSQFCVEPIRQLCDAVMEGKVDKVQSMLQGANVVLDAEERELQQKQLLRAVMRKFLPLSDTLLQMIVVKLPSPARAQRYRMEQLYAGPDDLHFQSASSCDSAGPLLVYVSKMVDAGGNAVALGRVFSGTVRADHAVAAVSPQRDASAKTVKGTLLMMGSRRLPIDDVPAGNLVGLVGVNCGQGATITDGGSVRHAGVRAMRRLQHSAPLVASIPVDTAKPHALPQLIKALQLLPLCDTQVRCCMEESGETVVTGVGERHLEACIRDLRGLVSGEMKVFQPFVSHRETVQAESTKSVLTKSPNKHNRIFAKAMPLADVLAIKMESEAGRYGADACPKARARLLADDFGWSIDEGRGIWSFGPDRCGPNVLVDMTKGVQNLEEVREWMVRGWQWATTEGVLAEAPLHGVRVNIEDVFRMSDAIHRGAGQIIPTARRNYMGCVLTAKPTLAEPVYVVDVQSDERDVGGVHGVLRSRRDAVLLDERRTGLVYSVRARVPVAESFGLAEELRKSADGRVTSQFSFDSWRKLPGDPFDAECPLGCQIRRMRVRKSLRLEIPSLDMFCDKR